METNRILHGDCLQVLGDVPDETVGLIVTSPPYADNRNSSYGGISPDDYVQWCGPIGEQLQRVLKRDGTFVLDFLPAAARLAWRLTNWGASTWESN